MDRNIFISYTIDNESRVALRKESVDRNIPVGTYKISAPVVALRKESVDRNRKHTKGPVHGGASLSARRAWIEIS